VKWLLVAVVVILAGLLCWLFGLLLEADSGQEPKDLDEQ